MLCLKTTAFGLDLCRRFFASAPGSAPGSKNRIKLLQALRLACDLFIITIFLPRCLSNPNTALTRGVSNAILIKRGENMGTVQDFFKILQKRRLRRRELGRVYSIIIRWWMRLYSRPLISLKRGNYWRKCRLACPSAKMWRKPFCLSRAYA